MVKSGDVYDITAKYTQLNQLGNDSTPKEKLKLLKTYEINKVSCQANKDSIEFVVNCKKLGKLRHDKLIMGISILNESGEYVAGFNNLHNQNESTMKNSFDIACHADASQLFAGNYIVNYSLYNEKFDLIDFKNNISTFSIKRTKDLSKDGKFNIPVTWQ
jgi:hypothetical protein